MEAVRSRVMISHMFNTHIPVVFSCVCARIFLFFICKTVYLIITKSIAQLSLPQQVIYKKKSFINPIRGNLFGAACCVKNTVQT